MAAGQAKNGRFRPDNHLAQEIYYRQVFCTSMISKFVGEIATRFDLNI